MTNLDYKEPLISIILPTYNRAHFIGETLSHIAEQSYKNWECLIIDDGSKDNTHDVVSSFLDNDERFKFFKRTESYAKGPSGARNMGLDLAKGDYIIFFDSDDIVHPQVLQICLDLLKDKNISFCRFNKTPFWGSWINSAFDRSEDFKIGFFTVDNISEMVTNEIPFACCTVMWHKSAIGNLKFNEKLSYAEEWEFYTRILSTGISGVSIDKSLYFNRKHSSSNTGEFWANDPVRRRSKVKAVKLVIDTLKKKDLLTHSLTKYFIQTGFFLKTPSIIDYILKKSGAGFLKRVKYKLGYKMYPIIRPVLKLKGAFKA